MRTTYRVAPGRRLIAVAFPAGLTLIAMAALAGCSGSGASSASGTPAGAATAPPAAALLALLALLAPLPEQPVSAAITMSVSPAGNATAMSLRPEATLCVVRMPL